MSHKWTIFSGNGAPEIANYESRDDWLKGRAHRIGGSDAQDDLFRFAYVDSLWRSGRKADASQLLKKRLSQKPPSPLEEDLLIKLS